MAQVHLKSKRSSIDESAWELNTHVFHREMQAPHCWIQHTAVVASALLFSSAYHIHCGCGTTDSGGACASSCSMAPQRLQTAASRHECGAQPRGMADECFQSEKWCDGA